MTRSAYTPVDFSAVLASSIHDMKNSLGTIRELITQLSLTNASDKYLMPLEFEASRMNNSLMQLLALYKIEIDKFSLNIDEYTVCEILNDIKAQQSALLDLSNITLEIEYNEDHLCYCDFDLICSAISSILNNAQRYSQQKIILSAGQYEDYIYFCIEDDGQGFPDNLLATNEINFNTGSTGLGLYFVATIARLHTHNNKTGYIKTENNSRLGGAKFTLMLP